MTRDEPTDAGSRPGRRLRLRQAVTVLAVSALLLWLVIGIVPGISVSAEGSVLIATITVCVVSAVMRPVLAVVATLLGWLGVVLVGLFAQALIFYAALSLTPDIALSGFWPAFWASWIYALLISAVGWVFDANDDELFVRDVLRHSKHQPTAARQDAAGVVVVQIDGLPAPLLRWAVQAGDLPTLSRWLRTGSHRLVDWRAQLPATTPASQAGILHGHSDAVPAFRWYEKESGRLTVTNHPKDATYVEEGMSDGRGLLADGGVSIGNIFSGDAARSLLTMSAGRGHGPTHEFTASYLRPFGFARSLLLTLGEMVKELYQGHRQQTRDIQPRIDRRTSYVALRGVTNVLLRDLNVRLLSEQMLAGTPVMYCDFTDYDEVAHHAGRPARSRLRLSSGSIGRWPCWNGSPASRRGPTGSSYFQTTARVKGRLSSSATANLLKPSYDVSCRPVPGRPPWVRAPASPPPAGTRNGGRCPACSPRSGQDPVQPPGSAARSCGGTSRPSPTWPRPMPSS